MSVKIDPEGPRRSKKDPVRLRELRQTSKAAFAASSFSSWFIYDKCQLLCSCKTIVERIDIDIIDTLQLFIHLMKSAKPLIRLLSRNAE